MAIGKRSLLNEHMVVVLNKVKGMEPEPVLKSILYYSQAEKEEVDYMISIDLLKEQAFADASGNQKKGYVLGDFGQEYFNNITGLQMQVDKREQAFLGNTSIEGVSDTGFDDRMSEMIRELDERGEKKIRTINDWKQKQKEQ